MIYEKKLVHPHHQRKCTPISIVPKTMNSIDDPVRCIYIYSVYFI